MTDLRPIVREKFLAFTAPLEGVVRWTQAAFFLSLLRWYQASF